MNVVIHKYGGMALATPQRVAQVAQRVAQCAAEGAVVTVVSAQGLVTDRLLDAAAQISSAPPARELDMLLCTGEIQSAALLSMALDAIGTPAVSLSGAQMGICTTSHHGAALITDVVPQRILAELARGRVVVGAGFQGLTDAGDATTLGRGASDTTAVALAGALGAARVVLYKEDVDGVYTADPRIVPAARKLAQVTYDDMLALSAAGAKVLHGRAVMLAQTHGIEILICQSAADTHGTCIGGDGSVEKLDVLGLAIDRNIGRIWVDGLDCAQEAAQSIFAALSRVEMLVDFISLSRSEICFTVHRRDLGTAYDITREIVPSGVFMDESLAKLSVVGGGMPYRYGVAAKVFDALQEIDVQAHMIASTETKITVLVDERHVSQAARAVHTKLGLDGEHDE